MRRLRRPATVVALASVLVLAGCSASNQDAVEAAGITESRAEDPVIPVGPGGEVTLTAGDLFFRDLEGIALDGEVVFNVDNIGGEHNVHIDQAAGDQQQIDLPPGQLTTGSLLLYGAAAGQQYIYYCTIPGHREAGMEGIITVFLDEETARENGGAAANEYEQNM
jgi:hypothetical protein